jgi:hypothetical protein
MNPLPQLFYFPCFLNKAEEFLISTTQKETLTSTSTLTSKNGLELSPQTSKTDPFRKITIPPSKNFARGNKLHTEN